MTRPDRRPRPRRRPSLESLEDRRLLAYGVGRPFEVAEDLNGFDARPFRSAVDASGRVTVVYGSIAESDGSFGVYIRRYDSSGLPLGGPTPVDSGAYGNQEGPRVAVDATGAAVVTWWNFDSLMMRRYDAAGRPVGGVATLSGRSDSRRDYEVVDLTADGFTIDFDGFLVRRYALDGTPTGATYLGGSAARAGWTAVESDDPGRVASPSGTVGVLLAWTTVRAREEAGGTVYDAQVWATFVSYDGRYAPPSLFRQVRGVTQAAAYGLQPRILDVPGRSLVAWLEETPDGRVLAAKPYDTDADPDAPGLAFATTPRGGTPDGSATTAAVAGGKVFVHYARPDAQGAAASYVREWDAYDLHSGDLDRLFQPSSEEIPTADDPTIVPTLGPDFWTFWVAAGPGELDFNDLRAARVYTGGRIRLIPDILRVSESDGAAAIRFVRTGDLSQGASIRVWTVAGGTALPGYDYTPIDVTLTFAPGRAEAEALVPIRDDGAPDGLRTVTFAYLLPNPDPRFPTPGSGTITIVDAQPATRRDLDFLDYDSAGLWTYNDVEGWRLLNPADPGAVIASPDRVAYIDYGPSGLWAWDGVRLWRKLNDVAPESMAYGAGRLFLDYGDRGLWSWSEREGWEKLNDVDPARIVADDRAAYVQFTRGGTWRWRPDLGYRLISDEAPQDMIPLMGALYLDYGPRGLWEWNSAGGDWRRLSHVDPVRMVASSSMLTIDFGAGGLWAWAPSPAKANVGTFTRLGDSTPGPLAASRTRLLAGRGEAGLKTWDAAASWRPLNDLVPLAIHAGAGRDDVLLDYGAAGLWTWSPTKGWNRINDVAPRAVART